MRFLMAVLISLTGLRTGPRFSVRDRLAVVSAMAACGEASDSTSFWLAAENG